MRSIVLFLLFSACAPTFSPTHTLCDLIVAGGVGGPAQETFLTRDDVQDAEFRILRALRDVSDIRVQNPRNVCQNMHSVRIYTHATPRFMHPSPGVGEVQGWCNCAAKVINIGTPPSLRWQDSALVHELVHLAQGCEPLQPPQAGEDREHANWERDGLNAAIANAENPQWNP